MTARRVVLCLVATIGGSIIFQSAAFAQQYQGTDAQRMACTPDVFRLCGAEIPDTHRIVGCLRQNIELLSRPCRAVFESSGGNLQQALPQQAVPRGHAIQPPYGARPYQQPYQDDDDDDE
jgi:hypothetical protein